MYYIYVCGFPITANFRGAMMLVYRVEKNGIGPYRHDEVDDKLWHKIASHNSGNSRPGPRSDGISIGLYKPDIYFGFKDIEQLKAWFKGARSALRKNGFNLVIYDVPKRWVYVGGKQVGFDMSKAWPMKTVKIP